MRGIPLISPPRKTARQDQPFNNSSGISCWGAFSTRKNYRRVDFRVSLASGLPTEGGFCKERYEVYQDKTKQGVNSFVCLWALTVYFLVFLKGILSFKVSPIVQTGFPSGLSVPPFHVLSLAYRCTYQDRRFPLPDALMSFPGKEQCRQSHSLPLLPSRLC